MLLKIRLLSKLASVDKIRYFCADLLQNFESICRHRVEKFFDKAAKKSHFSDLMEFRKKSRICTQRMVFRRKKPLTLLEVLICFFLISIAVIPLIAPYRFMLKESDEKLKELEIDRKVPLYYVELLSKFYAKEISFKNLDEECVFLLPDGGEYRFVPTERGWMIVYSFNSGDKTWVYDYLLPKEES